MLASPTGASRDHDQSVVKPLGKTRYGRGKQQQDRRESDSLVSLSALTMARHHESPETLKGTPMSTNRPRFPILTMRRTPRCAPFCDLTHIDQIRRKAIRTALIERDPNTSPLPALEAIAGSTLRVRRECPTGFLWKTWNRR